MKLRHCRVVNLDEVKWLQDGHGRRIVLGSGGFADIFKAVYLQQNVAFKMFRVDSKHPRERARMEMDMESNIMLQVEHRNVVEILGIVCDDNKGIYGMVLEYMPNGSLYDCLEKYELAWSIKLQILCDVCRALMYLHGKNVIHADIKSGNVLLDTRFTGKLSDFGVACHNDINTYPRSSNLNGGTPVYMAPETLAGEKATTESDSWSFGILCFEIAAELLRGFNVPMKRLPWAIGLVVRGQLQVPAIKISPITDAQIAAKVPHDCPEIFLAFMRECCQIEPFKRPPFYRLFPRASECFEKEFRTRLDADLLAMGCTEPVTETRSYATNGSRFSEIGTRRYDTNSSLEDEIETAKTATSVCRDTPDRKPTQTWIAVGVLAVIVAVFCCVPLLSVTMSETATGSAETRKPFAPYQKEQSNANKPFASPQKGKRKINKQFLSPDMEMGKTNKKLLSDKERAKVNKEFLLAADGGDLEKLKKQVRMGADLTCVDKVTGYTALHKASYWGDLQLIKYLVEELQLDIDVRSKSETGDLPIHVAALAGHLYVVLYFLELGVSKEVSRFDGWTLLHCSSTLTSVKYMVEELKLNIHQRSTDAHGVLPIHVAAEHGRLNVVKYFLDQGVSKDATRKNGWTMLHKSAEIGDVTSVKYMVEELWLDASQKNSDIDGALPIHLAASNGHLDVVKYFLERGVRKDVVRLDGWTILHCSSMGGFLASVKFMVEELKLDVNQRSTDGLGVFPIHVAEMYGRLTVVKYFLDQGVSKDVLLNNGWTMLHKSAETGNLTSVKQMVEELEMDINQRSKDKHGTLPIHLAARNGHLDIVKYFLERGVRKDVTSRNGYTILHFASGESGHLKSVKYMIKELQLDVNQRSTDATGEEPLHVAARYGHLEIVKYLIYRGADIRATRLDGRSLLHLASWKGHLHIVQYCVEELHCNTRVKDDYGKTPLQFAKAGKHQSVVEYLEKNS